MSGTTFDVNVIGADRTAFTSCPPRPLSRLPFLEAQGKTAPAGRAYCADGFTRRHPKRRQACPCCTQVTHSLS